MKQYQSPNGSSIVGTSDYVLVTAHIKGIHDDGTPDYAGDSKIDWDSQETQLLEGKLLYIDEDGVEWTFDQLTPIEESTDDE
ncbi:hypothetical protein EV128_12590 [Rhizobium azibense]|nr:hypothetical protein EV128_12590 [Rhizobium azibense]